ncbi:T9SS C-terminal target domain-containing [Brachionus plicatilis]|uniref:T9SS C-terminal target domain-containing n=1 Tax=Brachionus plicatilis TaxID=10195 RepID=A0A3M7P942_BRAPC|nr:T9SS C-terminal target domain-containing [Brachionus plicatilis]
MNPKIILLFVLGFFFPGKSQQTKILYKPLAKNTAILNPERGFYIHTEVFSKGNYQGLNAQTLSSYRSNNYSLILRVFYLEHFLTSDISTEYLSNIESDFSVIRAAGLKCIVRFAYSNDQTLVGKLDAKKDQMLRHINQLKRIFSANSDVILVVQAGFIGSWGEWYYTDNFGYPVPSSTDLKNRREILDALLSALPSTRMVQIRTPSYKRKLFSTTEPLTKSKAFKKAKVSRVGHHNDCFLASVSDFGTYETLYTPMGGETCNPNPPRSGCETALSELRMFHWSYLNAAYHPGVIDGFKKEKCYETILNELGYRFELVEANLPGSLRKVQKKFKIYISLRNTGFASLFNRRMVYLVLRNKNSNKEFSIKLKADPRFWHNNSSLKISQTIPMPKRVTKGNYTIFLNLPDMNTLLSKRPEYSIKFANQDLWESKTGFNRSCGMRSYFHIGYEHY